MLAAGALAGFINTLAGSGSAITLPLLTFLGLPATVANGTNRIGAIVQTLTAARGFHKSGNMPTQNVAWLAVPALLGAIIGALIAVELDEWTMNLFLGCLMIVLLFIVLLNPKKWLINQLPDSKRVKRWSNVLLFFLIGIHGGFVQAGVGVLLLTALVMSAGYGVIHGNGVKLLIVLAFTIPIFPLFVYYGQVHWFVGGLMAVGQSIGALVATRFAVRYENANIWVRRLLIVVIIMGMFQFFSSL